MHNNVLALCNRTEWQVVDNHSCDERSDEWDWVLRIAEHVALGQIVNVEIGGKFEPNVANLTCQTVLDTLSLVQDSFDADQYSLRHEEQLVFLLNKTSFDFGSDAVANEGTCTLRSILKHCSSQWLRE